MKQTIRVSKHALALSIVALACAALPCSAVTPPALTIADNLGNSVTVDSTGAVTYGGGCSLLACPGTPTIGAALTSNLGVINWSGTIGVFTITNATGETKPYLTTPAIDIGIGTLQTNSGSGVLTVSWTDTGFFAGAPVTLSTLTNYASGTGTTTYTAYIDPTNTPFGEESGTQIGQIAGATVNTTTVVTPTESTQPVSMTAVAAITLGSGGFFSNDFGLTATAVSNTVTPPPPSPMISLTKTASATTVAPFQKVTYTYVATNTGTAALTNVVITDDNATPNYAADDFTVCTIPSLAAGASQTCTASVYPPITEGANDCGSSATFNYSDYHPGGQLICKSQANGDIVFTFLADQSVIDNTFGSGASSDWPRGNSSANLLNCNAEFQVYDGKGNKCLDFATSYIAQNSSYISGWGPGGVFSVSAGNRGWISSIDTTASDCINKNRATATCLSNSPGTNPDWTNQQGYTVHVSCNAWGSNGFGGVQCPSLSNSFTKNGSCTQHQCKPVNSTVTNTATVTGTYGTTKVSATATATVTIVANPQTPTTPVPVPPTCNVWGKAPSQCQPKNGGHDGDGYSYCDGLLGTQVTCNNVPFVIGSASSACARSGGTVPLPSGKYSCLKFLGAGVNGAQYNQCFVITYTDGSTTTVNQNLSDWCNPSNFSGETVAKNMPYRITPNGGQQYISTNLYEYSIACNNSKTVKSVTLPNNRNVVVSAITMTP